MNRRQRQSIIAIVVSVVIGVLVAWAGSSGSTKIGSLPVFALCAIAAFAINWIAFIPAYASRTEKYFDITGTLTYLTTLALALAFADDLDARAVVVAILVAIWAIRLGTFLFARIQRDTKDSRFDRLKTDPLLFLRTWSMQAVWVLLTAACALAIITSQERPSFGLIGLVGVGTWAAGFAIEVIADRQKQAFRSDPANRDRFIDGGLWAWSRHPNYFGEIVLWTGIAVIAIPVLSGWRWAMLVSPIFVYALLTRVSGVPMLEAKARKRWGEDAEYRSYRDNTPVLIPRPPKPRSPRH